MEMDGGGGWRVDRVEWVEGVEGGGLVGLRVKGDRGIGWRSERDGGWQVVVGRGAGLGGGGAGSSGWLAPGAD